MRSGAPDDWNPECKFHQQGIRRNPGSTDIKSGIQHLESGIHGMESRIQDSLELPYIGQNTTLVCFTDYILTLHLKFTENRSSSAICDVLYTEQIGNLSSNELYIYWAIHRQGEE